MFCARSMISLWKTPSGACGIRRTGAVENHLRYCEGVLTLQGVVGSYFLKQLAHAAVIDVMGVDEIANRVNVQVSNEATE